MKKKVSLKDIAQEVGVSTALVSYVLSGKEKEARVGHEIAEVIRETARRMNYQPNQIAKSLKSGKSFTIGLIVADISNPFFANIARTIEDEAKKDNYTAIFGSSDENAEKSWNLINTLINRQVDGFIIAPTEHSEQQIKYLKDLNIPFVLIDRYFPTIQTNYVALNNFQAAFDATAHLIGRGYKRIGMVAYDNGLIHMVERRRGYEEALTHHGLPITPSLIRVVDFNGVRESIKTEVDNLLALPEPVDALFFATNTLSLHGLRHLNHLDYKIPDDIALICFDESDSFDFFYCGITCVSQPLGEIAREAVRILIEQINERSQETRQVTFGSKLLIRQSCGTL